METLASLLESKALADFVGHYSWIWPICEMLHFVGLTLLIGTIGMLDLRVLGVARTLPLAPLRRLVPWGIFGFVLCLITGIVFVSGDPFKEPIVNLEKGIFQLKMLFVLLGGINALMFYYLPSLRGLFENLGTGDNAPAVAKTVAATSLVIWFGVIYLGRMLPYGDAFYFIFYW
jgi:hypothetical protein